MHVLPLSSDQNGKEEGEDNLHGGVLIMGTRRRFIPELELEAGRLVQRSDRPAADAS